MADEVYEITERSSARYTATLLDEAGAAVPLTSLTALRLWLRTVRNGTVINARNDQDVLNTNGVTYHATSGLLTWALAPADNAIISDTGLEFHEAVFRATWDAGAKAKTWRVRIKVVDLAPITS